MLVSLMGAMMVMPLMMEIAVAVFVNLIDAMFVDGKNTVMSNAHSRLTSGNHVRVSAV